MFSVVLVMAGKGLRMNAKINKAILPLDGKPVFSYALDTFKEFDTEIILVINPDDESFVRSFVKDENIIIVHGGKTRQESVYNGLKAATKEFVMIHDAARALISKSTITNVLASWNKNNCVFVGKVPHDTIRSFDKDVYKTLDREKIICVETPQSASRSLFLEVHEKARKDNFVATDDCELVLKYSKAKLLMVPSDGYNFKITIPLDLTLAKCILDERKAKYD